MVRLFQFRLDFEIFNNFYDYKNKEFDDHPIQKFVKLFQ